jgi:hypothetical protein
MKTLLAMVLVTLLGAAPALAQEVYRWVDENGVVHYSDQPREGAERVRIATPQSYESQAQARPQGRDPDAPAETDDEFQYESIRIVAPEDDGAVWATGGGMTVLVAVQPALRDGDRIALSLNGVAVPGTPVANTRITVDGLIRGTHILQASVIGADGQMKVFSSDVTFHVLQASTNSPQRRP